MDSNGILDIGPSAGDGDAPVIVLLHGWGASKEIWLPVMRSDLSARYRLIALDMPGVGDRIADITDGDPKSLADSIACYLSELDIDEFAIIGHSQGANVAAWLALRYSECVTSLIIVSGALLSDKLPSAHHYLSPVYGKPLLDSLRNVAGVAGWIEGNLPPIQDSTLGWTRGYMRRSGYFHAHNRTPELLKQLHGLVGSPIDITQLNPAVHLTWIHGAKDSTIPLSHAREAIAARPSNSELIVYDDALHCPMDTHMERFIADVMRVVG